MRQGSSSRPVFGALRALGPCAVLACSLSACFEPVADVDPWGWGFHDAGPTLDGSADSFDASLAGDAEAWLADAETPPDADLAFDASARPDASPEPIDAGPFAPDSSAWLPDASFGRPDATPQWPDAATEPPDAAVIVVPPDAGFSSDAATRLDASVRPDAAAPGPDASSAGCSDGTREGFADERAFPSIAGCAGGFLIAGLINDPEPACARRAGNDSANPTGAGCSAADLCEAGFHLCRDAFEVAALSPAGCQDLGDEPGLFFATRQGSNGCSVCTLGTVTDPLVCDGATCLDGCAPNLATANDLFGCGTMGTLATQCGVLDRTSFDLCSALDGNWQCGQDGTHESLNVTKPSPEGGGVLCCAD